MYATPHISNVLSLRIAGTLNSVCLFAAFFYSIISFGEECALLQRLNGLNVMVMGVFTVYSQFGQPEICQG